MGFTKRKTLFGLLAMVMGLLMAAPDAGAAQVFQKTIGSGNASSSYRYFTGPVTAYYFSGSTTTSFARHHMYNVLYTQAEMQAAGIPAGAVIQDIEFNRTNTVTFADNTAKISMHMDNVSANTFSSTPYRTAASSMTQVIDSATFNLPAQTGWMSMGSMTPFAYTGGSLSVLTYIDLNDFNTMPWQGITSYTQGPTWKASSSSNEARGYSYRTASKTYHVGNPPLSTMSVSYNYQYYSIYQKTDVRITYIVPLTNTTTATPADATGGIEYELNQSALGGDTPYFWTIQRNSNADWVSLDAGTGRIFGTPPKALGGLIADFTVTLYDQGGLGDTVVRNYQIPIKTIPGLPYSQNFEQNLDGFQFETFPDLHEAAYHRNSEGSATPGGNGLVLDSNNIQSGWDLNPTHATNGATNVAILSDPQQWHQGPTLNQGLDHHGIATLVLDAPGVNKLDIQFDYRTVISSFSSGRETRTNFVVEWSDDLGANWNVATGPGANSGGTYNGNMSSFKQGEKISIDTISGNQEFVMIRFRWIVMYAHTTNNFSTYVAIDNLVVNSPLEVSYSTLPDAQELVPYEHKLTAAGGELPYTNFEVIGTLPVGMQLVQDGVDFYLRAAAQAIPLGESAKNFSFNLQVTDATNTKASNIVSMNVLPQPPALNFANLPTLPAAGEGQEYKYTLTASGGAQFEDGYRWYIDSVNVSWDIEIEETTGVITANPPVNSAGQTVVLAVRLEDAIGNSIVSNPAFEIDIVSGLQVVTNTALTEANEGTTYKETLLAVGGRPPYEWSFVSGEFPAGITLRPLEGTLIGAPERGQAGTFNFRLIVLDAGSQSIEKDFSLTINAATSNFFAITTAASLPAVGEGNDYDVDLSATGGFPPYQWSILPGTAPPGLSISSAGEIVGTPIAGSAKTYTVEVRITDSMGSTANRQFSVEVLPDILPVSIVTAPTLPSMREGEFYVSTIQASGGVAPFTWEIIDGGLPTSSPARVTDPKFNQAGASGVISGLPPANSVGNYSVTLRVTDAINQVSERTFSFFVDTAIGVGELRVQWHNNEYKMPRGREADSYGHTFKGTGGVEPYKFRLAQGSSQPPAGLSLNTFGALSGTPVNNSKGMYAFTVEIEDAIGNKATQPFTIEILGIDDEGEAAINPEPVEGDFSAGGGCAIAGSSQNWLLLALLALGTVAVLRRRRSEA